MVVDFEYSNSVLCVYVEGEFHHKVKLTDTELLNTLFSSRENVFRYYKAMAQSIDVDGNRYFLTINETPSTGEYTVTYSQTIAGCYCTLLKECGPELFKVLINSLKRLK